MNNFDILLANSLSADDLYLGHNPLSTEEIRKLYNAVKSNETIKTLELWGTHINDESAQYIANLISENKTLQEVYISKNQISDVGAKAIFNALKYNSSLRILNLASNNISSLQALSEALNFNSTLKEIVLANNKISDSEVWSFTRSFTNKTLTKLNINDNNVSSLNADYLASLLKKNEERQFIAPNNNNVNSKGFQQNSIFAFTPDYQFTSDENFKKFIRSRK